jgi:hypothetical protein
MNATKLIETVLSGESAKKTVERLVEVTAKTDANGRTVLRNDAVAKAREIVEKHFQAMTAELESSGIQGIDASIDDGYARINFGGPACPACY